jgi:hypothetical protein
MAVVHAASRKFIIACLINNHWQNLPLAFPDHFQIPVIHKQVPIN